MISEPSALTGVQQPTHLVVPPERDRTLGQEAAELAAAAGLELFPWQRTVLDVGMSVRTDGRWAARDVGLIVPRQNGKGSVLEALELYCLFVLGVDLILHSAHEFKTAKEAFLRVKRLIEQTPSLLREVRQFRTSNEEVSVELRSGGRLRFMARSSGSGRGFTGDLIVLDEAYRISPMMLAAMVPTLSARPNPQVWFTTSSPPEINEDSEHIRNMKKRAMQDDPGRLAWVEWSSPLNVDPDDREAWALVNPSLGATIDIESIEGERDTFKDRPDVFMVERLGVWKSQSLSAKIPLHAWDQVRVDESPHPERVCFGVDIPPDRAGVSVAVCSPDVDADTFTFEVADRRPGTEWVVPRCIELSDRYGRPPFVIDGAGPASGLVPDLEQAGLHVVVTSTREYVGACARIYDSVVNRSAFHTGQPELTTAVMGANTRRLGDAWAWSRTSSNVDISPLVASTLALWGAATIEPEPEAEKPAPVFAY